MKLRDGDQHRAARFFDIARLGNGSCLLFWDVVAQILAWQYPMQRS
jgi:hypothetical protein